MIDHTLLNKKKNSYIQTGKNTWMNGKEGKITVSIDINGLSPMDAKTSWWKVWWARGYLYSFNVSPHLLSISLGK